MISEPDVIWFLTGGAEQSALKFIESKNRYCFIASYQNNSWSSATEVKAYLNEKGINTEIFDLDKLESLTPIQHYLYKKEDPDICNLGVIGNSANCMIASFPEKKLLEEVLGIRTLEFSWEEVLKLEETKIEPDRKSFISDLSLPKLEKCKILINKLNTLIGKNDLRSLVMDCFTLAEYADYEPCLSASVFNNLNIPTAYEGDLCSAVGMIVFSRLLGRVPWMANLSHVTRTSAVFSHSTVPFYLLDDYEILDDCGTGGVVKGKIKKQQVTVFRIDRKLEYCFISLGEVINTGNILDVCGTQAEIKMSAKSLFLLREFPLGNHHLIVDGDHSDILAGYFKDKGFRIV